MKIIGHRGAAGLAPENTAASFKAALNAKVDGIEFDIRTSLDGQLVVNHDPEINGLKVAQTNFAELKAAKSDLLILQEAFDVIANKCPVIIEIKKGANMKVVVEDLKAMKLPSGMQIASFNMPILHAIKATFPNIELIVNEKWSGIRGGYRCRRLGTKFLTMNQRWLWFGFIKSMSRSGYKLAAYPLNNPKKAKRWAKSGLYATITDFPNLF